MSELSDCLARWGTVKIAELGERGLGSRGAEGPRVTTHLARYRWQPGLALARELPQDFSVALDCSATSDGHRAFTPCDATELFILQASIGGCALLTVLQEFDRHQRFSHYVMQMLYRQASRVREYFARRFKAHKDLYVPSAARTGQNGPHILPADLGLDADGAGRPWGPAELIERGQQKAREAGDANPAVARCIQLGLVEAARRNPLDPASLTEAEAKALVRAALFDLGPSAEPIDEPLLKRVVERFLHALECHINDSTEGFRLFFYTNAHDMIHQIAKKVRPDGPIRRDLVRQVLLEVIFRSFFYVGECVHVQMWAFCRALPQELDDNERARFDLLYAKQPYLGGLPLILLHDRFAFLKEVLLELLERPGGAQSLGVLLRMLDYYAQMAGSRRTADRDYKRQAQQRNVEGRIAQTFALTPEEVVPQGNESDLFQDIAEELFRSAGWACRCGTTSNHQASLVEEETTDGEVVVKMVCENCDDEKALGVSRDEFERIGWRVMPQ